MDNKKLQLTENKLLLENEELRQQVYEYEETLNSIRNGEIDAIVVSGVDGDKIYSLTSAETNYRIIIEEMNEGAITVSRDGLITYCNARFAELISEPMENLVGSYFVNYLQESEQQLFIDLLQSGLKGKIVGNMTYNLKNGHSLELKLSMSPITAGIQNEVCILFSDITQLKQQEIELMRFNDKLGEIILEKTNELTGTNIELKTSQIAILSMMEDSVEARNALEISNANLHLEIIEHNITEQELRESISNRQKVEEALRRSEAELFAILDSTPFPIALVDLMDNKIDYWSQSALTLFGHTAPTSSEWYELAYPDPDYRQKVIDRWKPFLDVAKKSGKTVYTGEFMVTCHDGSVLNCELFATFLKDKLLVTFNDITERKKAESQIRMLNEELDQRVIQRTRQLEAVNKELEAFSYSVSHDLRAPLRAVNSFTDILLEDYETILDEEGKRICGIISSGAKQMGELIDDLLSFSRIGRSEVNSGMLDMKSLANSVINEIYGEKSKDRANLKLGKLSKVYGDSNLIRIVWTNLISNAVKYSSHEPFSEIVISSRQQDNTIIYSVKDNGVGFDMQYKHKLFGVFQRLHSEKDFEGNGVGLAIVQRIINKHGGKVWAEGEVGKGATFFFSLPVQEINKKTLNSRLTTNGI